MKLRNDFADDKRFAFFHEWPGVLHVDWQPGNGTRYECVFTELPEGDVVMSRITGGGGQCMRLAPHGILVDDYLTEKTGLGGSGVKGSDCAALLILISMVLPKQVALPCGYGMDAEYDGTDVRRIVESGRQILPAA